MKKLTIFWSSDKVFSLFEYDCTQWGHGMNGSQQSKDNAIQLSWLGFLFKKKLKALSFNDTWVKWVSTFYLGTIPLMKMNGKLGEPLYLSRLVRHGLFLFSLSIHLGDACFKVHVKPLSIWSQGVHFANFGGTWSIFYWWYNVFPGWVCK